MLRTNNRLATWPFALAHPHALSSALCSLLPSLCLLSAVPFVGLTLIYPPLNDGRPRCTASTPHGSRYGVSRPEQSPRPPWAPSVSLHDCACSIMHCRFCMLFGWLRARRWTENLPAKPRRPRGQLRQPRLPVLGRRGCTPLNYSDNPGVNGVSYRGTGGDQWRPLALPAQRRRREGVQPDISRYCVSVHFSTICFLLGLHCAALYCELGSLGS